MNLCAALRLVAGLVVLVGVVLTVTASQFWLLLVVFVSLNQIQSAFTRTCPAVYILKKLGVQGEV